MAGRPGSVAGWRLHRPRDAPLRPKVSTGALHGLNPATAGQEYWQSYVQTSAGTLSEVKMQKNFDAPAEQQYGTGGKP